MAKKTRKQLLKMYDFVGDFFGGLALARKDGKFFHIRPDGTPAYEQRYDSVGNFFGGLAVVRKGDKLFYIRPDGTVAS